MTNLFAKLVAKLIRKPTVTVTELDKEPSGSQLHTATFRLKDKKGTFASVIWDHENGQYYYAEKLSQMTDDVKCVLEGISYKEPLELEDIINRLSRVKRKGLAIDIQRRDFL